MENLEDLEERLKPYFDVILYELSGLGSTDIAIILGGVLAEVVSDFENPHRRLTELFIFTKKIIDHPDRK